MLIKCKRCGKEIEKKWKREYCVKCSNIIYKEKQKAFREEHRDELKARAKSYYEKRKALKEDDNTD